MKEMNSIMWHEQIISYSMKLVKGEIVPQEEGWKGRRKPVVYKHDVATSWS